MANIKITNHDNGIESILSEEDFNYLQYMFSENSSYEKIEEVKESCVCLLI